VRGCCNNAITENENPVDEVVDEVVVVKSNPVVKETVVVF